MFFLQFAVLGSFIISLGGYLSSQGLGEYIGQFYILGGFVNLVFPALFGIVADRYVPAQKLYGSVHLLLAVFLVVFAFYLKDGLDVSGVPIAIVIFSVISCLYYPTIPMAFSVSFISLRYRKADVQKDVPVVRMFGTIGFVVAMVLTDLLGVQFSYGQFLVGAAFALTLSIWSLLLPDCPSGQNISFGGFLSGFKLLKDKRISIFFFFVLCVGVTLKLSEAYVNPFFSALKIDHPNILASISRISETFCILLIPISLKMLGVRKTIALAIAAWCIHFAFLACGAMSDSIWPLVISMVVYGIGFDFFNIAGMIYVDSLVKPEVRSTAQGLFAMFTNGFGCIIGAVTGQLLFKSYVFSSSSPDWSSPWFVISVGCFVLLSLFFLLRRYICV